MINLDAINDRLEAAKTHSDHPVFHAVLLDAWTLVDEVERLRAHDAFWRAWNAEAKAEVCQED